MEYAMQKILFAVISNTEMLIGSESVLRLNELCREEDVEAVLFRCTLGRELDFNSSVSPEAPGMHLVTLQCPEQLGYGERVKLSFDYALEQCIDAVVILDDELRYPLEKVRELLRPVLRGEADMVLAIPAGEGGLQRASSSDPRYLVQPAARFTSKLLNSLTKAKLRGWHCGFRAYRVQSLARLPYRCNASSRMFNTEIIIQYLLSGMSIAEIPVPGYRHQRLKFAEKVRFAAEMVKGCCLSVRARAGSTA